MFININLKLFFFAIKNNNKLDSNIKLEDKNKKLIDQDENKLKKDSE